MICIASIFKEIFLEKRKLQNQITEYNIMSSANSVLETTLFASSLTLTLDGFTRFKRAPDRLIGLS